MIESQGWELAQLAYDERQSRNGGVLLLFRRAAPAVPPAADDYDGYYQDVPSESYQAVPFGRHSHRRGAGHVQRARSGAPALPGRRRGTLVSVRIGSDLAG